MPTAYGYGRQSDPDPKSPDSPEIQEAATADHYQRKLAPEGFTWGGFVADLGVSGGKAFASRPQGAILARKLERGDVVIFAKLDRGFRDTEDLLATHRIWKATGIRLILLDMNVDTATPLGELFLTIGGAFATFERQRIGERMREIARKRKAEGRPVSGRAPYGWRIGGPKGNRKFEPNPEQRKVGQLILGWRLEGVSWEEIYLTLVRRGSKQPNGQEYSYGTIQNYALQEARLQATEMERAKGKAGPTE